MVQLTEVQKNLFDQLRIQRPFFKIEYNIKTFLTIKNGLRLHTRNRNKIINIDIIYNNGLDLYEITAYKINGVKCKIIAEYREVYFDKLHDLIQDIIFKPETWINKEVI